MSYLWGRFIYLLLSVNILIKIAWIRHRRQKMAPFEYISNVAPQPHNYTRVLCFIIFYIGSEMPFLSCTAFYFIFTWKWIWVMQPHIRSVLYSLTLFNLSAMRWGCCLLSDKELTYMMPTWLRLIWSFWKLNKLSVCVCYVTIINYHCCDYHCMLSLSSGD